MRHQTNEEIKRSVFVWAVVDNNIYYEKSKWPFSFMMMKV